jgi:hypothetical protein
MENTTSGLKLKIFLVSLELRYVLTYNYILWMYWSFKKIIVPEFEYVVHIDASTLRYDVITGLIEALLCCQPLLVSDVENTSECQSFILRSLLLIDETHTVAEVRHLSHDCKRISETITYADSLEWDL